MTEPNSSPPPTARQGSGDPADLVTRLLPRLAEMSQLLEDFGIAAERLHEAFGLLCDELVHGARCEEPDCKGSAILCKLPEAESIRALCPDHAVEQGYCRSCGEFWAGIESFDLRASGLCDHCHDELCADFDDRPDYDEESPYGY